MITKLKNIWTQKQGKNLKFRILMPMISALILLFVAFIFGIYHLQKNAIRFQVEKSIISFDKVLKLELDREAAYLASLIEALQYDEKLRAIWLKKDRQKIESHLTPLFDKLLSRNVATQLYLHETNRANFVRIHDTQRVEKFGDVVERQTLITAQLTGMPCYGIEIGSMGIFTLRVVYPWFIDGQLTGFIEIGNETGQIMQSIYDNYQVDFILAIDKNFLKRDRWERGLKMLDREGNWETLNNYAIVDKTIKKVPEDIINMINANLDANLKPLAEFSLQNSQYIPGIIPIVDVSRNEVGKMILLYDITEQKAALKKVILVITSICGFTGLFLLFLFTYVINRIDRQLESSNQEILNEKQALLEHEKLLNATLESSADGILVVNRSGKVTHANSRFIEMWKIPEEIFRTGDENKLLVSILDQLEDPAEFMAKVKKLYESIEEDFNSIYFKDGRVFERYSCPLIQNDEIAGRVWNFRSITERINAEKQRKELQNQLTKAERMESLGVLAGGVAHDLNNILGPLVAYPEIIKMQLPEDSPAINNINKIENSANRAAEIVQDLLTLSRRGRYEMTPTIFNSVIRSYLQSPDYIALKSKYPEVEVSTSFGDNNPAVYGSAAHLYKVIMNLVINAFEAMPDGGNLQIKSECKFISELISGFDVINDGEYILLTVSDTGSGINEKDLKRVFEPFYSKKKLGKSGSGLGLAIVYGVIKDHNGYIDIKSVENKGSEFFIYLPIVNIATTTRSKAGVDIRGSEKILVVDDMVEQRELAATVLTSLGYEVDVAINGRDAIKYLKSNPVDVVILDMIMEEDFDGLDTYKEIIKISPNQKAIIASGFSETNRVKEAEKLGVGKYIRKPYTMQIMGKAIREVLVAAEIQNQCV